MVTTDSVCDLPESLIKEFGISVCPYYVCTDQGRFLDDIELKADELLEHMASGKRDAHSLRKWQTMKSSSHRS